LLATSDQNSARLDLEIADFLQLSTYVYVPKLRKILLKKAVVIICKLSASAAQWFLRYVCVWLVSE